MLQKLIIENYAIIDHLEIDFRPGLNIFTGETGAGKSIIVGAISMLLGERFASGMLRKGAKKGYVEGAFDFSQFAGTESLSSGTVRKNGNGNNITLKRELTASGGSKVFINGKPETLQTLKKSVSEFIDLHGQHQHQSLIHPEHYYDTIDRYGKAATPTKKVAGSFKSITDLQSRKETIIQKQNELDEIRDYLEFQLKEIRSVDPQDGEIEALEQEWNVLQNAEKITSLTSDSYRSLYDNEKSAAAQIRNVCGLLQELRSILPDMEAIENDLSAALVAVEESASLLQRYSDRMEFNPQRLEEINERLASLLHLQKKHKINISGIIKKAAEMEADLNSGDSFNLELKEIAHLIETEKKEYGMLCAALSKKRVKTAEKLQKKIVERLKQLGMEKSLFVIDVTQRESETDNSTATSVTINNKTYFGDNHGIDTIQFLIATGKAEHLMPISHIASGGELSRIMLAIKSVLMSADRIPILIFDEIDTGISGRIASAVGRELNNLARYHQLLCVTHLPQIASMADRHLYVEKIEHNGRIVTRVRTLDPKERIFETAKLLAGDTITDHHMKSAEEMLNSRR